MAEDMSGWVPREKPERVVLDGHYVRLEPLDAAQHGRELFEASQAADAEEKFRWLAENPVADEAAFMAWVEKSETSEDPLYFAVIDKTTGKVAGRQTFMRIDTQNGVIEIGNIYWGPLIARKRAATEALYLFMRHAFADLGYRRFEWKCNNDNEPSKRAARRFGFTFEGVFRQHLIVKGLNRDTAWFSIIDKEWPALEKAYESWLSPANFEANGQQRQRLEAFRAAYEQ